MDIQTCRQKLKELEEQVSDLTRKIEDLELAINFSYDGLHLLDEQGITVLINRACEVNEGLYFDEIKGKSMARLVKEGVLSESVTLRVLEEKQTVSLIQHVKTGKDMLVTGTPIIDEEGNITRVMVNSRDITELNWLKKKLAEAEVRFQETQNRLLELDAARDIPSHIVCRSSAMKKVLDTASIVAGVDSHVLITGESGTGKGVISKYIHEKSKRNSKPYIKVDCSSIPETLFESELFGYEGGAFTGASSKGKIGLMELADGGTLFLDEIGELPLSCQAKLLRGIQDKEIVRIGGDRVIPVDVRIISATNRNLSEMVENKAFREDLYYRINVVPISVPPLRQRQEDIPDLINSFVQRLCERYGFERRINIDAVELLMECEWKGNVRELENLVERLVIISGKALIGVEDLPNHIKNQPVQKKLLYHSDQSLGKTMEDFERLVLEDYVKKGKKPVEMAEVLDVNVTTIRRKLKKYGIKY